MPIFSSHDFGGVSRLGLRFEQQTQFHKKIAHMTIITLQYITIRQTQQNDQEIQGPVTNHFHFLSIQPILCNIFFITDLNSEHNGQACTCVYILLTINCLTALYVTMHHETLVKPANKVCELQSKMCTTVQLRTEFYKDAQNSMRCKSTSECCMDANSITF